MSTSEATGAPGTDALHVDRDLVRRLVLVNGAVPAVLLAYDAWQRHLGANGTKFAIHTAGLLALLFFVLSLVVTPLRRLTGFRELVATRRALGLYGYFYLVLHFGIFFVFDRDASVSGTVHEILTRRYLQIGTLALVLFTPLALTSTDGMISRLGPRRWKRLHRLTYVATSLGALHYILQQKSKSDLGQPLLFAGAILGLLLSRVVFARTDREARARKKRAKPWSGELVVLATRDETHDVRTFLLATLDGSDLPFTHAPGQYLNLVLDIDGKPVRRSYTIASAPTTRGHCEITVKKAQDGWASKHLHERLAKGAAIRVTAPAGRFVFDGEDHRRVLLLAGGVGITPLMAMVRTLADRRWPGRVDLVFSAKTQADVVFARELEEIATRFPGLHLTVTLTREPPGSGWTGERGAISRDLLLAVAPELHGAPIYLCGPEPMMEAVKATLAGLGVPAANVHVEAFVSPKAMREDDATAMEAEESAAPAESGQKTVAFSTSGESTTVDEGETLLEAAEELGIDIPFDCRAGICGQCKTHLVKGRVVMSVQDALTDDDRKRRLVLACQARPLGDVVVEA
jgi:ferredoxin-NADP reductase/DMSO/TMAO reductase YedYZ heme-binding membrane subunit